MAEKLFSENDLKRYDSSIRNRIPYYDIVQTEIFRLLRCLGKKPEFWLDTGSGTGNLITIAQKIYTKTKFFYSDVNPKMEELAREKLSDSVYYLPQSKSMEIETKQRFDVITSFLAHHYSQEEERRKTHQKMFDLLKKDGIFIEVLFTSAESENGIELQKKQWVDFCSASGTEEKLIEKNIAQWGKERIFPLPVSFQIDSFKEAGFLEPELFWFGITVAGFYAVK